ncbi:MAG: hydroxymethylglutaryl-CoA lyase [Verrucomicrobiota bacterium]
MEPVKIIECPRDAWQGLKRQIPTDRKIEYLRALVAAGFRHIDAVSFVSPKAVPQMADSEQVLKRLGPLTDVEIIGIVVNEKGAERAIATGAVNTLGYPCSISETFLRRNQNQSPEENQAVLKKIKYRANEIGLTMVAYISMAFGNPYGDPWNERKVAEAAKMIASLGIKAVSIADTAGSAGPELVYRVVTTILRACSGCEVGVHLHSTRAGAAAKILAAYDAGCRRFDAAIGGLGGCPFAQDELVGNVPTEEVLHALEKRGLKLPLKDALKVVAAMNAAISDEFSNDDA